MDDYVDELESLLDDLDLGEFEERARRGRTRTTVRTPTRRSSFQARPTPAPASQGQVQAAARSLDGKIETLSNAVKALETRTNGIAADVDRSGVALRKEIAERRKSSDAVRADLQQTKMMSLLLPLLTQGTVPAQDANGNQIQVVTQSSNQLATLLPVLLLVGGGSGGEGKGGLGDTTTLLLLVMLLGRR